MLDALDGVEEVGTAIDGLEVRKVLLFDNHRVDYVQSRAIATAEIEHILWVLVADGNLETIGVDNMVEQHRIVSVDTVCRNGQRVAQRCLITL
jgi:hypothetical protein